jgi:colanic acid biosynthesis glycosyl transferase WcaI
MAQVCEELHARGHELSVVTTFPHYEHFRVWDEYRGKLLQGASYKGMNVLRTWVYASGTKQRMVHRLASYLSFNAIATVAGLLSRRTYDVVLCTNGSFFTGITAYVRGLTRHVPFVYNVQDLYPETPVAAGQLTNRRAIAALERLERFMYRHAAHVSVITPAFRDNIAAKGVPAEKISVIPNFVDTEFIRPLPKANAFAAANGLADRFVVTHAGNLGYVYDLDTMLDAAALLRNEADILFLIVGDGVAKPALQGKAAALGLDNVRFLPFQPQEDLPWLRAASDVQVSLYRHGSARYSMPSKIYEIMASGRPLLASADRGSDVWNLVEATGCGVCVPPEDAPALADAVLELARNPDRREAMAAAGRQHAVQSYSRAAIGAQYDALLRQVAARRVGSPR